MFCHPPAQVPSIDRYCREINHLAQLTQQLLLPCFVLLLNVMRSATAKIALTATATLVFATPINAFRSPSHSTICRHSALASPLCATPKEKQIETERSPLLPFDDGFPTIEIEEPPQEDIYKQAISRTILWVGLAAAFGAGLFVLVDPATSEEVSFIAIMSPSHLYLLTLFLVSLFGQHKVFRWVFS